MNRGGYPRWLVNFIELTSPGFWIYFIVAALVAACVGIFFAIQQHIIRR